MGEGGLKLLKKPSMIFERFPIQYPCEAQGHENFFILLKDYFPNVDISVARWSLKGNGKVIHLNKITVVKRHTQLS